MSDNAQTRSDSLLFHGVIEAPSETTRAYLPHDEKRFRSPTSVTERAGRTLYIYIYIYVCVYIFCIHIYIPHTCMYITHTTIQSLLSLVTHTNEEKGVGGFKTLSAESTPSTEYTNKNPCIKTCNIYGSYNAHTAQSLPVPSTRSPVRGAGNR